MKSTIPILRITLFMLDGRVFTMHCLTSDDTTEVLEVIRNTPGVKALGCEAISEEVESPDFLAERN